MGIWIFYYSFGTRKIKCNADERFRRRLDRAEPISVLCADATESLSITLPDGSGFTAEVDAMSGDFRSDFDYKEVDDRYISGDGSCRIGLSAMSGDVHIRKAQ